MVLNGLKSKNKQKIYWGFVLFRNLTDFFPSGLDEELSEFSCKSGNETMMCDVAMTVNIFIDV